MNLAQWWDIFSNYAGYLGCATHNKAKQLIDMTIIGENVRYWREQRKLGINELARLAGVDPGNLHRLETGKAGASIETLAKLAAALKIPVAYLLKEEANVVEATEGTRRIAILDWNRVHMWVDKGPDSSGEKMKDHVFLSTSASSEAFALRVRGDAMEPDFKQGDLIVIDPLRQPRPGSFVLALDSNNEPTFKQYRDLGLDDQGQRVFELLPLNPLYPPRRSDREELRIVGTAVKFSRDLE